MANIISKSVSSSTVNPVDVKKNDKAKNGLK